MDEIIKLKWGGIIVGPPHAPPLMVISSARAFALQECHATDTMTYYKGDLNVISYVSYHHWDLTDAQLLWYFNCHCPQHHNWKIFHPKPEMQNMIISVVYNSHSRKDSAPAVPSQETPHGKVDGAIYLLALPPNIYRMDIQYHIYIYLFNGCVWDSWQWAAQTSTGALLKATCGTWHRYFTGWGENTPNCTGWGTSNFGFGGSYRTTCGINCHHIE